MKKNIIFILCTIIILCFGSIVNAGTSFKDVKDTKYEDSVNKLITLGLVNGYPEDNTYRPNNVVTRAEMAKLMVVALGEEDKVADAQKASPKFKDVTSKDWEYGYVNLAAELGIINGYPDGSFASKNTVSYAEATTMMIRALEYENEVSKSTEVWPNNYISKAKDLSIYNSMGTVNASEGAKRGNIAIMLWNMLRTGMCTIVGENSNGLVYGEGEIMLNQKITKFSYLEDALVTDVDFDDEYKDAEVKFKGEKTIKITLDALEAAKMYGQKFTLLYNNTTKEIEDIIESEDNNLKEGEIEKITSSKIYIEGASSKGYELPDDNNILLYGIEDLDEAASAILVLDGSKLEYLIAFAPDKVYLALVTDTGITVSDKEGIKVANYKSSSTKSYALENEDSIPEESDIILYYLNSDDELVVLNNINVFDSKSITSASSTKIKFDNKTYKFADISYQIAEVDDTSLKSMSVSDIQDDEDSVALIQFAGEYYFIVFVGGVENAEAELSTDMKNATNKLSNYMEKSAIKNALNNEIKYTQSTYANFMNSYNSAQTALDNAKKTVNKANLTKVEEGYTNLQTAYKNLKKISTLSSSAREDEEEKVEQKAALRKIVNGTTSISGRKAPICVINKDTYTETSYKTFDTALSTANTVLKSTDSSLTKIKDAKTNLENAMKNLVLKTDETSRKNAITALDEALKLAENKAKNASDYTDTTYANFLSRWNEAKDVKKSSTTVSVDTIKEATKNLNNAIEILSESMDELINELNALLSDARMKLAKTQEYMPDSYNKVKQAVENAETAKANSNVTEDTLTNVTTALNNALNSLVTVNDELKRVKTLASKYKEVEGINLSESTYEQKLIKITTIKESVKKEEDVDKTLAELMKKQSKYPNIEEFNLTAETYNQKIAKVNALEKAIEEKELRISLDEKMNELRKAILYLKGTNKDTDLNIAADLEKVLTEATELSINPDATIEEIENMIMKIGTKLGPLAFPEGVL